MEHWAIKAIEREAMNRALDHVQRMGVASVAGLTVKQIIWLKYEYEKRTGGPVPAEPTSADLAV
jgi:hypothetical protein